MSNSEETYRRTLVKAARAVGGARALCKRVGIPMREMTMWLEGKSTPPMAVFLRVIDILLDDAGKPAFRPTQPDDKPAKPK